MEINAQTLPVPSAEVVVDLDNCTFKASYDNNWIIVSMNDKSCYPPKIALAFPKNSLELRKIAAAVNQIADFIEAD